MVRSAFLFRLLLPGTFLGGLLVTGCASDAGNRDPHGPRNLERYIQRLESTERDSYQHPDEVVKALHLGERDVVADVGCGPGYFSLRLARAVPGGVVYAVDIEPAQLDRLNEHLEAEGIRNVVPVLAVQKNPRLPPRSVDLILIVNTYHHIDHRAEYLKALAEILRPGGRLAIIDFYKKPLPIGPAPGHKVARDVVLQETARAGFQLEEEPTFLPYQYFLVLETTRETW